MMATKQNRPATAGRHARTTRGKSLEEEVGFPALVERTDIMPDERHMVGTYRPAAQGHLGFLRCPVPLPVVAFNTCTHQIFPGLFATARCRENVVNRQGKIAPSAELT